MDETRIERFAEPGPGATPDEMQDSVARKCGQPGRAWTADLAGRSPWRRPQARGASLHPPGPREHRALTFDAAHTLTTIIFVR